MHLKNAFRNSCNNRKYFYKKLFLPIKDCLVYNIVNLGKPNIFSLKLKLNNIETMSFSSPVPSIILLINLIIGYWL